MDSLEENQDLINSLLTNYNTSRIDIKNSRIENNSVEIIKNSDPSSDVEYPNWFKNELGEGITIKSNVGVIDLKIKCIEDGTLRIYIKSNDTRDKNNNHFPVYINYTSVIVNKKEHLKENTLVYHDEPLIIMREVKNNEIISIHAEWMPFNSKTSIYKNKTFTKLEEDIEKLTKKNKQQKKEIEKLTKKNKQQKKEIEKLTKKNKQLENKLKEISNSSLLEFRKLKKEL